MDYDIVHGRAGAGTGSGDGDGVGELGSWELGAGSWQLELSAGIEIGESRARAFPTTASLG